MRQKLSKHFLDGLIPKKGKASLFPLKGKRFFDAELTGFFACAYPHKPPVFGVYYGPETGRRQVTIGPYGIFTLDAARDEAKRIIASVKLGANPAQEKAAKLATPTFKHWAQEYIQGTASRLSPKWAYETRRYLEAVPFGSVPLPDVSVQDIERFTAKLRETRGKTTANRALAAVRACLSAAWRRSMIVDNPAKKVKPFRESEPRSRVLNDDELSRFLEALSQEHDHGIQLAFRLLLETGARVSEVLKAKWEDFELEGKAWRLPKTKAGRPQMIPLTSELVDLLRAARKSGAYVLPGPVPEKPRASLHMPWKRITQRAGLPKDIHLHDLRRTYGLAVARAAGLLAASKLLRHSDPRVTSRVYAPFDLDALREAAETTAKDRRKRLKVVNGAVDDK
jgi:integrase